MPKHGTNSLHQRYCALKACNDLCWSPSRLEEQNHFVRFTRTKERISLSAISTNFVETKFERILHGYQIVASMRKTIRQRRFVQRSLPRWLVPSQLQTFKGKPTPSACFQVKLGLRYFGFQTRGCLGPIRLL